MYLEALTCPDKLLVKYESTEKQLYFFPPQAVSTLLKIIKISFKKNSSNKILVNGGQVGEHYKRINHCFSRTIEDDSLFELKEELIFINEPLRKTVTYLGYLTETYRDFRQRQFFTRKTFHGVRSVEEKTRSPDYFCEGKFNHKTLDNVNEAIEDFWGKYGTR